jgi:hypothetical protein
MDCVPIGIDEVERDLQVAHLPASFTALTRSNGVAAMDGGRLQYLIPDFTDKSKRVRGIHPELKTTVEARGGGFRHASHPGRPRNSQKGPRR